MTLDSVIAIRMMSTICDKSELRAVRDKHSNRTKVLIIVMVTIDCLLCVFIFTYNEIKLAQRETKVQGLPEIPKEVAIAVSSITVLFFLGYFFVIGLLKYWFKDQCGPIKRIADSMMTFLWVLTLQALAIAASIILGFFFVYNEEDHTYRVMALEFQYDVFPLPEIIIPILFILYTHRVNFDDKLNTYTADSNRDQSVEPFKRRETTDQNFTLSEEELLKLEEQDHSN